MPDKKRILLAEDNEDTRLILRLIIESLGYEVTVAQDGREAVEMASSQLPDLVVMDILMPVMDGFEAIRRIREDPKIGSVPILAATVLATPGDRAKCLASGLDEYLSKPFTRSELEAAIKKLI
ncbi:MAG: response regulator [Deltaproteobacteria bacterium]|nr:response regulator [Deltaproteobacteria bacterium]